jgi:hypothetical protein
VKRYGIEAEAAVEADVEAAFDWYEVEEAGLGSQFLEELSATYQRILDNPLGYQELRSGIRRALTRRFPYAVYFFVEERDHRYRRGSSHCARSCRVAATHLASVATIPHSVTDG